MAAGRPVRPRSRKRPALHMQARQPNGRTCEKVNAEDQKPGSSNGPGSGLRRPVMGPGPAALPLKVG